MSFEPVLNELSLEHPAPDIAEARRRMTRFIRTFTRATGEYKLKRTLRVKDENVNYLELAPEYSLHLWSYDKQVPREERVFFNQLQTKQPYLVEHADKEDTAVTMECYWTNKPAVGFQAALLLDTLAMSLPSDPVWNTSRVEVLVRELDLDGEWLPESVEQVYHVGRAGHLQELAAWIAQRRQAEENQQLQAIQTSADVWKQRHILCPSLEFCAIVQDQLVEHAPQIDHIKAIRLRLLYLEQYSQQWRQSGGKFNKDHLAGNASPERAVTLQHPDYGPRRIFRCPDGQERTFSWHLKMFDGWRLHFYPDEERQTIIVGYIGPHLPTVKFHN